jgi:hypothetical protein
MKHPLIPAEQMKDKTILRNPDFLEAITLISKAANEAADRGEFVLVGVFNEDVLGRELSAKVLKDEFLAYALNSTLQDLGYHNYYYLVSSSTKHSLCWSSPGKKSF